MVRKLRALMNRLSGIKLRYRLLFVYIIGGALPVILIGLYLMRGMSGILIEQAKEAEVTELKMARRQIEEMLDTVSTVTKYFYFDPKLEEISRKQYKNYQEVVNDYRDFTSFLDYSKYYNNTIAWINIYMENQTIVGNSRFIRVTQQMRQEEWYQAVGERKGAALWRYRHIPSAQDQALAMLRMLRTEKGEDVGVLAVYIRPERFMQLLPGGECDTFVFLNGEITVTDQAKAISAEQAMGALAGQGGGQLQENVTIDGQEYVMTCESILLVESREHLQLVSFRAYRDILQEAFGQLGKSAALFAGSALLSIAVILVFSRSFGSRVERFREQMQKAADGNFELEENLGGSDEISDLYAYLGTMIYRIQRLLAEIYQEKLHAEQLTIRQKDAEFQMLASQINPHFLYNTLETIRMRARRSRQPDIEELVKMLAKIMRSTLQAGSSQVTIRAEAELVEYYLKIQQYRFGDRIRYHIFVEEDLQGCYILPLLMQPIVENSIIHGLESKEGVGTIRIEVRRRDENVVISIEDDGLGIPEERLRKMRESMNSHHERGSHIGVSNVHQRVKLRYGEAYGVRIDSVSGQFTRVEILLPGAEKLRGMEDVSGDDN